MGNKKGEARMEKGSKKKKPEQKVNIVEYFNRMMDRIDEWGNKMATKEDLREGLTSLEAKMDTRFNQVDERFDRVEGRLDGVEGRLDGVGGRLDRVEIVVTEISNRLDRVETVVTETSKDVKEIKEKIDNHEVRIINLEKGIA